MFIVPKDAILHADLSSVLEAEGLLDGNLLIILSRRPNPHASTFPSEVVTCRVGDEREIQIFCKYSDRQNNRAFGHRGGINYEAEVYRKLLGKIDKTVPYFYGAQFEDEKNGGRLFLEFLENSMRVSKSSDPEAMLKAVRWIGKFHSRCRSMVAGTGMDFLKKYDSDYYMGWAERTLSFSRNSDCRSVWLETICTRFIDVIDILFDAPLTVIHGEYYPKNIMVREGVIYPVDWESTAFSAGEIDIASLSEGWGEEHMRQFEEEYISTRWPNGVSYDTRRVICAARIYLFFRWMGERPEWLASQTKDLSDLRKAADTLGLL